jgi:hypothetical protein
VLAFLQGLKSVCVVFLGLVSLIVVVAAVGSHPSLCHFPLPIRTSPSSFVLTLQVPQTSNLKFSTRKIPTVALVFLVGLYHDFLWCNHGCFSYVSADIKYLWLLVFELFVIL